MTDCTVREATADDAEAIVELARRLSLEENSPLPPLRAEHVRAEGFGEVRRFRVLIAERTGEALGYALFFPSYDTDHAARGFYLQDLYVRAEARRQGVGRALMAAVARAARPTAAATSSGTRTPRTLPVSPSTGRSALRTSES